MKVGDDCDKAREEIEVRQEEDRKEKKFRASMPSYLNPSLSTDREIWRAMEEGALADAGNQHWVLTSAGKVDLDTYVEVVDAIHVHENPAVACKRHQISRKMYQAIGVLAFGADHMSREWARHLPGKEASC